MGGRRKRSEKVEVAVRPAPVRVEAEVVAVKMIAAICPCCGKTIPEKRAIKAGYVTVDRVDYFASIGWVENKPFGVSYSPGGRGSMGTDYISPEDAPELFEAVKARFLQAIREWLGKGWIKPEELPR